MKSSKNLYVLVDYIIIFSKASQKYYATVRNSPEIMSADYFKIYYIFCRYPKFHLLSPPLPLPRHTPARPGPWTECVVLCSLRFSFSLTCFTGPTTSSSSTGNSSSTISSEKAPFCTFSLCSTGPTTSLSSTGELKLYNFLWKR